VLAFFLHNLIGPREKDGRPEERHVDKDLPLDVFWVFMLDVYERFEKMNAGDTDQRGCKFNLDGAGVDVGQPVRTIGMALQIQFAYEGGVAADNHHREQIRHHCDVDQPQDPQHEDGLLLLVDVADHLPQFDEKLVRIEQLGHDEAAIERGLNPATGEHDGFKQMLNTATCRVGVRHCGGF
jgi:hypothetical protein